MKPKPVILIVPSTQRRGVEFLDDSLSLSNRYPRAILEAGGLPWVMPCLASPEPAWHGHLGHGLEQDVQPAPCVGLRDSSTHSARGQAHAAPLRDVTHRPNRRRLLDCAGSVTLLDRLGATQARDDSQRTRRRDLEQTAEGLRQPFMPPASTGTFGTDLSQELVRESVRRCDGVMLTGGDDVDPTLYGPEPSPRLKKKLAQVDPVRDQVDLAVIREVFRQRKPLLAICRGQQILNVALGGTLILDLPTQLPQALDHNQTQRKSEIVHEVTLTRGSLLAKIVGRSTVGVNSTHHQAVDRVAAPLRATAVSADGVVEALEWGEKGREPMPFMLAVQFHPERLLDRVPEWRALFRSFVRAAAIPRARRQ